MKTIQRVFEYPFGRLKSEGEFPLKGSWGEKCFGNDHPIVLELGCGKGEYTVGLARRFPDKNFIGIDIKGARMWKGAKEMQENDIANAAFLRTDISLISHFFSAGEVAEIWITFPDPQMKKATKRLTGTRMLATYQGILADTATIHLKTDSPFLYNYTLAVIEFNELALVAKSDDLHSSPELPQTLHEIRTHYEEQWLARGMRIKYLAWRLTKRDTYCEPDVEIEPDDYRSYNRFNRSAPQTKK